MRRSRRLKMWSALFPYLGGKRKLCPLIFREIDRVVPRRFWSGLTVLDAFLGGGAASVGPKGQRLRGTAGAGVLRLLAVRVALLAHPMSQVRPGTAHRASTGEWESITESCLYHYTEAFRLTTPGKLWDLAQQINAGVFQGEAKVMKTDILEALPSIQADVAYFDPPYPGVMSYEKEYRIIDQLLEGTTRPTSPFTAKTGASMLDTLFERAQHIPLWVLSLGNEVVTIEELEAKMTKL